MLLVAVLVAGRPERVPLALALMFTVRWDVGRAVDRRPVRNSTSESMRRRMRPCWLRRAVRNRHGGTATPSSRCRVDVIEVMIEPWWRRVATFGSCTAEDHRGAPSLRPIIVKMPKHDAATAKSWMLQQPMVVARVGGVAEWLSVGARRVACVACGFSSLGKGTA